MRKLPFLFLFLFSILSFVGFFVFPRSALAGYVSFHDDSFDLYHLGDLPVPYYAKVSKIAIVSNDRYFGPPGTYSVLFHDNGTTISGFKYDEDVIPPLYPDLLTGYFYYDSIKGSGAKKSLYFGTGNSSSSLQQYLLFDTNNLLVSIEGHTISSFTSNAWVYVALYLDYDLNKVKGCVGDNGSALVCSSWYTPASAVSTDNTYFVSYGSGETGYTYLDCVGCSYDQFEEYSKFKPSDNPDENELAMYIDAFKTKFPIGILTYIYDFFFNLSVPDVPSASLSVSILGSSFTVLDFTWLDNAEITIPGTETTIDATTLIRNFFILVLWFLLIEFLVWWALSLFGK